MDCGVKRKIERISKIRQIVDQLRISSQIVDSGCQEVCIMDPKRTSNCGSYTFLVGTCMLAFSALFLG